MAGDPGAWHHSNLVQTASLSLMPLQDCKLQHTIYYFSTLNNFFLSLMCTNV